MNRYFTQQQLNCVQIFVDHFWTNFIEYVIQRHTLVFLGVGTQKTRGTKPEGLIQTQYMENCVMLLHCVRNYMKALLQTLKACSDNRCGLLLGFVFVSKATVI